MRKKAIAAIMTATMLSGCATDGNQSGLDKQTVGTVLGGVLGAVAGSRFGGGSGKLVAGLVGAAAGAYLGNRIGAALDESDRAAIEQQSSQALSQANDGQTINWNNPQTGASATITPTSTRTEERKVPVVREKRVAPLPRMTLIGETWEAAKSANVRTAPTTSADIVTGLKAGDTFQAVGKVDGSDWIVVGRNSRTIGYVNASLVRKAKATQVASAESASMRPAVNLDQMQKSSGVDLDAQGLVAEEVTVASTCRTMDINVKAKDAQPEAQNLKACKGSDGAWEIL